MQRKRASELGRKLVMTFRAFESDAQRIPRAPLAKILGQFTIELEVIAETRHAQRTFPPGAPMAVKRIHAPNHVVITQGDPRAACQTRGRTPRMERACRDTSLL